MPLEVVRGQILGRIWNFITYNSRTMYEMSTTSVPGPLGSSIADIRSEMFPIGRSRSALFRPVRYKAGPTCPVSQKRCPALFLGCPEVNYASPRYRESCYTIIKHLYHRPKVLQSALICTGTRVYKSQLPLILLKGGRGR